MKRLFILFFIIILTQISYALTFDEFAKTYDYYYNINEFNITNTSFECIKDCENLTFLFSIQNSPGNYEFSFYLDEKSYYINKYLFENSSMIHAVFYPEFSKNINLLSTTIKKEGILIYQKLNQEIDLSNITFKQYNLSIIEEYVINNTLFIITNLDSMNYSKNYSITAYLLNTKTNEITLFKTNYFAKNYDNNTNTYNTNLSLMFEPDSDSTFILKKILIDNYNFYPNYTTLFYNISKIKIINDSIDTNNFNNLKINILNNKNKLIIFNLYSIEGDFITNITTDLNIVYFNSSMINSTGIFGQYKIIYNYNNITKEYLTNYYDYNHFNNFSEIINNNSLNDNSSSVSNLIKNLIQSVSTVVKTTLSFFEENKNNEINNSFIIFNLTENNTYDTNIEINSSFKKDAETKLLPNKLNQNSLTGNIISQPKFNVNFNYKSYWIIFLSFLTIIIILFFYLHKRKMSEVVIIK